MTTLSASDAAELRALANRIRDLLGWGIERSVANDPDLLGRIAIFAERGARMRVVFDAQPCRVSGEMVRDAEDGRLERMKLFEEQIAIEDDARTGTETH